MDSKIIIITGKGFTLIELVICMMLMSIIISIEIPLVHGYEVKRQEELLNNAALELLADMRLYQAKAMMEGSVNHIYFDSIDDSYMVYTYKGLDNCILKRKSLPGSVAFDNINSTYRDNKISFNSRGKPVPYPCTVALKNSNGQVKDIVISVATDYIYLRDK